MYFKYKVQSTAFVILYFKVQSTKYIAQGKYYPTLLRREFLAVIDIFLSPHFCLLMTHVGDKFPGTKKLSPMGDNSIKATVLIWYALPSRSLQMTQYRVLKQTLSLIDDVL